MIISSNDRARHETSGLCIRTPTFYLRYTQKKTLKYLAQLTIHKWFGQFSSITTKKKLNFMWIFFIYIFWVSMWFWHLLALNLFIENNKFLLFSHRTPTIRSKTKIVRREKGTFKSHQIPFLFMIKEKSIKPLLSIKRFIQS